MATKKKLKKSEGAQGISAKKGDQFTYAESDTVVEVCGVHDEDETVDVQEPEGDHRYWGGVPANSDWLKPVAE